jgi:hypothetical protein
VLEALEVSVALDALLLLQVLVDSDRGEVVLAQQMVKHLSSLDASHKHYHLVEVK